MPDNNSFSNLVNEVRGNLSGATNAASTSLAQNSFTEDPIALALQRVQESQYQPDAWVSRTGELDTIQGGAANLAASFTAGGSRTLGEIISAVPALSAGDLGNIPNQYLQAYDVVSKADAEGIDNAEVTQARKLLDQRESDAEMGYHPSTYGERIENALGDIQTTRDITETFDISNIVNVGKRQQLQEDITKAYVESSPKVTEGLARLRDGNLDGLGDVAEGAAELIFEGGESLITNPMATAEYIAENIPQLLGGILGKAGKTAVATSNVGYGANIFADAVSEYQEEHGELPTQDKIRDIALLAASASAAEQAGEVFQLAGSKAIAKAVKPTAKAAEKSTTRALVEGAKAGVGSGISEGITEAYQTAVEESLVKGKPVDWAKVYEGAVIGAGAGAGTSVALGTAQESARQSAEVTKKAQAELATKKTTAKEAAETGDLSKVEDLETRMDARIQRAAREDVSEEEKETSLQEANKEVGTELERIESMSTELDSLIAKDEPTKQDKARITQLNKDIESALVEYEKASELQSGLTEATVPAEETEQDVAKGIEGDTEAAQRAFGSHQLNPTSLSAEQAEQLAEADNGLSEQQNQELRNHAELENYISSIEGVRSDVVNGGENPRTGKRNLGIRDYQRTINAAKAAGDTDTAKTFLGYMGRFVESQQQKATDLETAMEDISARRPVTPEVKQRLAAKGIKSITGKTARLTKAVREEADMLKGAYDILSKGESYEATSSPVERPQSLVAEQQEVQPTVQAVDKQVREADAVGKDTTAVREPTRANIAPVGGTLAEQSEVTDEVDQVTTQPEPEGRVSPRPVGEEVTTTTEDISETEQVDEVTPRGQVDRERVGTAESIGEPSLSEVPETVTAAEPIKDYKLSKEYVGEQTTSADVRQDNQVKANFVAGSNNSALETINDFINRARIDPNVIAKFLPNGQMTSEAQTVLESFIGFYDQLAPQIDSMVQKLEDNYTHKDYVQYLMNEDGTLDSNIKTAMVVGAYNWTIANGNMSMYNTAEDIRSILGLGENDVVPRNVINLLQDKGSTEASVKETMGQSAAAALNLKTTKNSAMNAKTMLENSLGIYAYEAMNRAGMFIKSEVTKKELDTAFNAKGKHKVEVKQRFVSVRDPNDIERMNSKLDSLITANKFMSNFTAKVFGSTREKPEPTDMPVKIEAGATVKNSIMKLATRTREILNKYNARPWVVDEESFNAFAFLGLAGQREVMGYNTDLDSLMTVKKKAAESVNNSIDREINTFSDFAEGLQTKKNQLASRFYLSWEVWKNQRMGIKNSINPQSSKLHRHLMGMSEWRTLVKFNDTNAYNEYLITLAGGFDITPEKQSKQDTLDKFAEVQANPVIQAGVQAIRDMNRDPDADIDINEQRRLAILDAVKEGGHNMFTLQSLTTMAKEQDAKAAGQPGFSHIMAREVDGITNGVAILTSQFPDANEDRFFDKMNRMGMYADGETNVYSEWKTQPGNKDSYQSIAAKWQASIMQNMPTATKGQQFIYKAAQQVIGDFGSVINQMEDITAQNIDVGKAGRNAAKAPLMTTAYGAGMGAVFGAFVNSFLDNFYNQMQDAIDNDDVDTANKLLYIAKELAGAKVKKLRPNEDEVTVDLLAELQGFELSPRAVNTLTAALAQVYAAPLIQAMEQEYPELFKARDEYNAAINVASKVFSAIYERKVLELIDSKDSWINNSSEITIAEHNQIMTELANVVPAIRTLMGGNDFTSGLELVNSEREGQGTKANSAYRIQVRVKNGDKTQNIYNGGRKLVFKMPGVGSMPKGVQSLDATNMLRTLATQPVLNVHDAIMASERNIDEAAKAINLAHLDNMKRYSLPSEMFNLYSRTLQYANQQYPGLLDDVVKDPEVVRAINKPFGFKGNERSVQDLREVYRQLKQSTDRFNERRIKYLNKITSSNQYSLGEGTNYSPTEKEMANVTNASKKDAQAVRDIAKSAPQSKTEIQKELNSHDGSDAFAGTAYDPAQEITPETSEAIFEQLGTMGTVKDSSAHTAHLRSVLTGIIGKALQPINMYIADKIGVTSMGKITATDMYILNSVNGEGQAELSGAIASDIRMSTQEVYVHELTHAITRTGVDKNITARRDLKRLWTVANKLIRSPQMKTVYEDNKELFDRAFNPKTVYQGKSDYLHEFVALGLTNETMRSVLEQIPATSLKSDWFEGDNLFEKLQSMFNKLLDSVNGYLQGTINLTGDKQMDNLARRLATIEAENRGQVIKAASKIFDFSSTQATNANRFIKTKVAKAISSTLVKKYGGKVGAVAQGIQKAATDSVIADKLMEGIGVMTKSIRESENAAVQELYALSIEAAGRTAKNGALHDMRRVSKSNIDRQRQLIMNAVKDTLNSAFDPERKLSGSQKTGLFYGFMKTDFNTLLKHHSLSDAVDLMRDIAARKARIKDLQKRLKEYGSYNFFNLQAENLGYFMVHGESRLDMGLLNARNISRKMLTGESVPAKASEIEVLVDELATLHAIGFSKKSHIAAALQVAQHELNRGVDENGIQVMMSTLGQIRERSTKDLFKDSPELMIKGYVLDRTDPSVDVRTGTLADADKFAAEGYVRVQLLAKDPTDVVTQDMYIYVNRHGGLNSYLAQATYLMSNTRRGTDTVDLRMNANDASPVKQGFDDVAKINVVKTQKAKLQYATGILPPINPDKPKTVPVVNPKGEAVGFRYIMKERTKDTLMGRDTSFDEVMSIMAGDVDAKPKIAEANNQVVEALREVYNKEYSQDPTMFVEISAKSKNPRYREIYKMFPYEMQQKIKSTWGGERMYVRRSDIDLMFGYRKHSAANKWNVSPEFRGAYDKVFIGLAEAAFGAKAVSRIRMAEDVLQELVKFAKDIIVIKSFVVTLANTISNLSLLMTMGVNPVNAFRDYAVSFKAAGDYRRSARRQAELELRLENTGISDRQRFVYERELAQVKDDIANNPVKDLIDGGVLQNIVEDVDITDQDFSYRAKGIEKLAQSKGAKILEEAVPSWMKSLGKNVFVMQGSEVYTALREAAQLSDFGARYALYQNRINQKKNPMDKDTAIGYVMDIFIDYDTPTGVYTQYANDMGFLMFSKYLIRVQRIIAKTFADRPLQVMTMALLQNYFNFGTNIHESLIGITNPLDRMGLPTEYLSALDELPMSQLVGALYD